VLVRGSAETGDGPAPRYGRSVSYTPCPACGEGSLVYDEDEGASVCRACGAVDEAPEG